MTQKRILMVEDDPSEIALCKAYLAKEPYDFSSVDRGAKAIEALNDNCPDAIILDLKLPDMNGFDILKHIAEQEQPCEVVVVTGNGSMNVAVEAMQLGARDFMMKPYNKERLITTLKNTFENQALKRIVRTYQEEIDRHEYCGFIGSSLAMQRVYTIIDSAADSKATVFITGESGTGKEVCAEAIHKKSNRAKGPFIAINCGAIPKDLIESELFGHVKGAFTGALKDRDGSVRSAHGGTLFLDEICEMDMALQPKLLRFLQTGSFNKVGSDKLEHVDVRIVCATNKDPLKQVANGNFREDLYYRLHVLPMILPPLTTRDGDVIEIANHFLKTYAREESKEFERFSNEVEAVFSAYNWPGNIRQLQNVVRNIVVLNKGEIVTPNMLPAPLDDLIDENLHVATPRAQVTIQQIPAHDHITPLPPTTAPASSALPISVEEIRPMADVEREHIENAIKLCEGNIPQASHYLGISAATIYRKKSAWKE
ncbi:sigma-54 dependent transcriptional regulator [Terasakiella sp. SH-1]|uniref:sigma-54-dependent transcriptional regulator n=1 Tax=Terasakiella sp. SH-1 TaxID=2560057 RepID=UPI0010736EE8|nr:sigma-54 dependent transcriptional regulator [Terasakiella sp. SH-1]